MGFELGRRVREAAGELGSRIVRRARDLQRIAHARAGRVWLDLGERLRVQVTVALDAKRDEGVDNAEPNAAVGPRTRALIEAMAEVLSRSGYRAIHADVDGEAAPEVVHGTMRSHRPSLSAIGGGRPVLIDVYLPEESDDYEHLSRWELFSSAATQTGGEFHVVVPTWIEGEPGRGWVRDVSDATGISVTKVWEV